MKIAMIGTRGMPATAGGVEHHVQELATRLVQRGHDVTVYARSNYVPAGTREVDGVAIRRLPTVATKHLDAVVQSALASVDAVPRHFDVVHFHAMGPALFTPVSRFAGRSAVVATVHGIDHDRDKWGTAARNVLRLGAWTLAHTAHQTIVVSQQLLEHYAATYERPVTMIPNGVVEPRPQPPREITERFGLRGDYVLFAGRLVPEKQVDTLIRAYRDVDGDRPLVVAGDATFLPGYATKLRELAAEDPRVKLVGFAGGDAYRELLSNAAVFVLPSAVEGMPITLLEAASYGVPLVASDIAPHKEVLGDDAVGRRQFPMGDAAGLARTLTAVLANVDREQEAARRLAPAVIDSYSWDGIVARTEEVYRAASSAAANRSSSSAQRARMRG